MNYPYGAAGGTCDFGAELVLFRASVRAVVGLSIDLRIKLWRIEEIMVLISGGMEEVLKKQLFPWEMGSHKQASTFLPILKIPKDLRSE